MEEHLRDEENGWSSGNKRNGTGNKIVKSNLGEVTIETPQDRKSGFEPKIVKKKAAHISRQSGRPDPPCMAWEAVCGIYQPYPGDVYTEVSTEVISGITDRVVPKVKEWQSRPLEDVYCIVWLDAMHFKVREDGKVRHKALYNVLGINK